MPSEEFEMEETTEQCVSSADLDLAVYFRHLPISLYLHSHVLGSSPAIQDRNLLSSLISVSLVCSESSTGRSDLILQDTKHISGQVTRPTTGMCSSLHFVRHAALTPAQRIITVSSFHWHCAAFSRVRHASR